MTLTHKAHKHLLGSRQGQASDALSRQITAAVQGSSDSGWYLLKAVAAVFIAQVWQRSAGPAAIVAAAAVVAA